MMSKKRLLKLSSVGLLVLAWQASSLLIQSELILPSPLTVIRDASRLIGEPLFYGSLANTFLRSIFSFLLSALLSALLGLAAGLFDDFASFISPWMTVIKSTPVVSFILIALFWFGTDLVPIFVSILMTLPIMTEAISAGIRQTDAKLLEMARIYHFKKRDILTHIQIPSAMPFFLSGAGSALGLTWKVVVAGEILALPRSGLGSALQTAKIHLETPRVFSITIMTIMLSLLTELAFSFLARSTRTYLEKEAKK
ncbi:ABC transporter permease subunit [Treponema zuelzerae]|uniref:ABC transporter permease subunit n=1 Tax=Teretinema zuelzerae TaxID=156 RepID=A0AAE3EHQ5_9SPIR|nr:ABC transporter permease subunit [Teretinema zuelzerae]MCD1654601.1 ABC transporter permease subunit [Teretinema zuelzerae]